MKRITPKQLLGSMLEIYLEGLKGKERSAKRGDDISAVSYLGTYYAMDLLAAKLKIRDEFDELKSNAPEEHEKRFC